MLPVLQDTVNLSQISNDSHSTYALVDFTERSGANLFDELNLIVRNVQSITHGQVHYAHISQRVRHDNSELTKFVHVSASLVVASHDTLHRNVGVAR